MRKTACIVMGLITWIVVSACGNSEESEIVKTEPRAVQTQQVVSRDLPVRVAAAGRLIPDREVVVSAQVSGIVQAFNADVGDRVKTDDVLVKLDPLDYTLALSEAEANLLSAQARFSAAEKTFSRAKRLLPEKAISVELFDQAEAEYRASQAQVSQLTSVVEIARQRLSKTEIKTPFDGYVTQRSVELGQNIGAGVPVMSIADMTAMRVRIYINENDYVRLDQQDPVSVMIEAFSGETFPGRVDKIGIKADARTNTFEVEILLDNPELKLKAGLTARVSIQTEMIHDAITIPQKSVLFREERREVFIVDQENRAVAREVALGPADGAEVRILKGLAPGDRLVVSGGQYLKTGDALLVVE